MNFMKGNNLLDPDQHGFIPNRSTVTQLLVMTNEWAKLINSKRAFHCVYFDQKAAFDRIDHKLLMHKMKTIGIHAATCTLIEDYLRDRSFRVRVDGSLSDREHTISGVSQGGCVSSLLYTIFVMDFKTYLPPQVRCLQCADDLKVFMPIASEHDHLVLQQAVAGVSSWCEENGMSLSIAKCVVLKYGVSHFNYHINGTEIPTVDETRDLGIQMTANLDFSRHIPMATRSAGTLINSLFRCFITQKPEMNIHLYKTIVLPKLLYGSPIWSPHLAKHIDLLEGIQRKFIERLIWR